MKYIFLFVCVLFFLSCKKQTPNISNDEMAITTGEKKSSKNIYLTSRVNTGFTTITANSNGTYSGNGIIFSSITYRLGAFQTGESVNSIGIQSYANAGATIESYGPTFVIFIPTMSGVNTNFHQDFVKYKAAWDKAMKGDTSIPIVNDFMKNEYSNPSGTVVKGIVVRDSSSPSTFSIAPGTYQPIVKTTQSTGSFGILGELLKNGYTIDFKGYFSTGYIEDVIVLNSSSQNVGVQWFSLQSSKANPSGYNVSGTIMLASGSTILINDFIDGF